MEAKPLTILGIDLGARRIGISVFKNRQLIFFAVKTLGLNNSRLKIERLKQIVNEFVASYEIDRVALTKIVFVQQHRSFVKVVYDELRSYLSKLPLGYSEFNPAEIRNLICGHERSTRANTALMLAQRFPELRRYSSVSKVWQKKYYSLLLDAVAVGFACAANLSAPIKS